MRLASVLGLLLALGGANHARAFEIEYGLDRPAELKACDEHLYRGERAEAQSCYVALMTNSNDTRIKADAARSAGDVRAANGYFQAAIKEYPQDPAVRARWGELFARTHQNEEAVKLFQESLGIDKDYAPAKLGLAEVAAGSFDDQARKWANEVIEQAPEQSVKAYILLARMDLEDGAVDAADAKLDRALQIADKEHLTPLEIFALKASEDLLRGNTDSDWTRRALKLNPGYGEIYATPAHFYVITRRYREAIALFERAVEIEPNLYSAQAELGENLLRVNKIAEAQQHLAIAYRGDPFSAPIVNTLRLIDSFDNFVVSKHMPAEGAADGKAATGPGSDEKLGPHNHGVILRLHKSESAVLEPYVLKLVNRAIETYTKRYNFELKQPVVVEMYPEHDDFAVRTSGLPGIGLLGVTFGYLVAMDSPTGRADSDFHWGTTLWHEMAHVFTLEATHHLVPRWFSEGISVYEEWSTGPLPGRHIPLVVFKAIKEKKFLPIAELDRGFIHPTYEAQVIVSYMEAGLICEYIGKRFGQKGLVAVLDQYGAGKDTTEALKAALDLTPEQFDKDFAGYVDEQLGSVVAVLDNWREANQAAQEALRGKHWEEAASKAAHAIDLFPDYVDEGSAYLAKAKGESELKRQDAAIATLLEYRRRGGHDPDALLKLANWLEEAKRPADSLAVLEDVLMVAPLRPEVHQELGDRLLAAGRPAEAAVEYRALLAMNPHDLAEAHFRLAKAYFAAKDRSRCREQLLYALEIAPNYREAQQLLLEIVR